jgi:light-regulated signal transduction histidine kinase (bacteriophytochrome)
VQQLAEFRHRVRSELNQILGYTELLLEDQSAEIPSVCRERLRELQALSRRVLQHAQAILSGDCCEEAELRLEIGKVMRQPLHDMEVAIRHLVNELPPTQLGDVQRVQAAFLGLREALEAPIGETRHLSRGALRNVDVDEPYLASIPSDLKIKGRLLVIDDSEANRQLLVRQLVDLGLDVETAEDGPAGLAALAEHKYDCILLDMILPEMSGPAVLRSIRENPAWVDIPVIMLSALDELAEAARCIEIGAEDYLIRPVEGALLRAKLHSTIQRKYLYEDCQQLGRDLAAANEELKQFVMVASHDLQAPLRTLQANLKTIQGSLSEDSRREVGGLIEDSATRCLRMSGLVNDLLVYARMGQLAPFLESIELDWVLSEALANLADAIQTQGAVVRRDPLPCVRADFKQMLYLLQNLIGNAVRYRSLATPLIEIGAEDRGELWMIYVKDNGIGIPVPQQQRIFEPFHRLHGEEIPGTGLGLAIAKRAVEQAGGKIWVTSTPGEGSTFLFTLPKPEVLDSTGGGDWGVGVQGG